MDAILDRLRAANAEFQSRFPGESEKRQPVHTVYGGAHLFKSTTAARIGEIALRSLRDYAPDAGTFAGALGLSGPASLHEEVYRRVEAKLRREAVEDFRIDFEDGFGSRPDAEEDEAARTAATETAKGMKAGTLPPFIGIRVKSLSEENKRRSLRTLERFVTALVEQAGGRLPENFVATLPKITHEGQVAAFVEALELLEKRLSLPAGALKMEFMIETPQSLFGAGGEIALPGYLAVAKGRCVAAHFGTYDFTASVNITAEHQTMDHPSCDFARHIMKVALAGTPIWLSDGATNVMPVGPHKGKELTERQKRENVEAVHRAWKLNADHVRHSLRHAYYQGWDLHPAQLPVRYGALYSFFLEGLDAASARLRNFIEKAAQATLVGDVFDDAATGQGLLNYFLRALNCGAIAEAEIAATGLTLEEIQTRSFMKILDGRKGR
ncbi:MAG: phosphoenolpyruvate kinase [Candidatus Handelsmanbacteria bacterium RIFCSPLOWO2_12_FULL_64_10]|uniref:Phosphoenolpyruvate kinase n=1 Tax=Handelsmanbacteria sp. (strain RIFCSPLOWO2_12_FULL_64_10) TaxID=1817868 RepID=A0A1F6D2D6_HANXR|nr:MAG: phosphoenolpyruvate kinase [Candidatus Handelsmanbacteria bacterium RIFCSPLOWO2_12_FULL_64_10]